MCFYCICFSVPLKNQLPHLRFSRLSQCVQRHHSFWRNTRCHAKVRHNNAPPMKWIRGAKTKSTLEIRPLPQGVLPQMAPIELAKDDAPAYPTVIQQARNNMQKFSHCVVLTRVGSFYEMYFDQAEEYGPLLNLKIGKKGTNAGNVPMAGFPYFQLDRFLKVLVQDLRKHVAISEEFPNDVEGRAKSGGLLFDRRVARVITPGTLIDEKFMNPLENNYLLSVQLDDGLPQKEEEADTRRRPRVLDVGLAWLDLSSGDFFTQQSTLAALSTAIARITPREILLPSRAQEDVDPHISSILREEQHTVTFTPPITDVDAGWSSVVESTSQEPNETAFSKLEKKASAVLVQYVNNQLQGVKPELLFPLQKRDGEFLELDKNTLRALEVRETLRDGAFQGSLLHAVRRTVTKGGARLLNQRLAAPSMSLADINHRLDMVTELIDRSVLHQNLIILLRDTFDSQRLVQKFTFGRGDADDLLSLSRTVSVMEQLLKISEPQTAVEDATEQDNAATGKHRLHIQELLGRLSLEGPSKLASRIRRSIDEDKLMEQHRVEDKVAAEMYELVDEMLATEGEAPLKGVPLSVRAAQSANTPVGKSADSAPGEPWIMRKGASAILQKLHKDLEHLQEEKDSLELRLRAELGATSLTLRWTPGLGHICHIKGGPKERKALSTAESARLVRSSKTTQSYHLPGWTHLGNRTEAAKMRIQVEENRIFANLRQQVVHNLVDIRRNAGVLDEVDVACSFATFAREQALVRPILNASPSLNIIGGRHPTVEAGLTMQGRTFTSNNCHLSEKQRISLITGPNMGGKSTFLRQNALIAILAQTGSYVPAEYAKIGLIDKIFSRVGSADNLYQDQSTFMVEMLETAEILKQATERSFVIMDEVGRGTTPEDGTAVSFAALHHLYNVNKSRVLFATHFHILGDMVDNVDGVSCYCTDVEELSDGGWTFVHRLREGVNRHSHAIGVARLAGLPDDAIQAAKKVLQRLHREPMPKVSLPRLSESHID